MSVVLGFSQMATPYINSRLLCVSVDRPLSTARVYAVNKHWEFRDVHPAGGTDHISTGVEGDPPEGDLQNNSGHESHKHLLFLSSGK